ncbi:MAG: MBL fold metallo-hydrolase [Deltaproteobacteria bacterium]|nr:MBL fold metallo-hydrolase [Deltaproteobacteria bacterium]
MEIVANTPTHPLADGQVQLLGAIDCVTGAMTRVELGGKKLLVDCGVAQGRDQRTWSFPEGARDCDAVVLTHGHLDHVGSLPELLEGDFDGRIVATAPTLEITRISLEDTLGMNALSERAISRILKRFDALASPMPYGKSAKAMLGLDVTFRDAGHILGSASVEISSARSRVILSGDLGRPDSPILPDYTTTWSATPPVDLVVMESTYGGRDHAHGSKDIEAKLESVVRQAVAEKSRILVPSFAIGRTQVLLWYMNELVESRRIPPIPVAIDTPMGLVVTETYNRFRRLFDRESLEKIARGDDPLDFDGLFAVRRGRDSARLLEVEGPIMIIAGSGMCTGGRIVHHLRRGLSNKRTIVLFVGHQAEGTPGRRIQEAAERGSRVTIDGEEILVRARIDTVRGLSAHADRGELLRWLKFIPEVRKVALHHGERVAQEAFVAYAAEQCRGA